MQINDLARLSDKGREAFDVGFVAAAPAAEPFGAGPMPLWLLATLIVATIVAVLLIRYSWKLGKAERAKAAVAEQELDQDQWAAYQRYGEPPSPNAPHRQQSNASQL